MSRKKRNPPLPPFVKGGVGGFVCFLFLCFFASQSAIAGDGHLFLYNYHANEVLDVTYKTPEGYDKEALQKINYLLRSPDNKVFPIPTALIELVDEIQDHFCAEAVEIISGYRSPAYNVDLKKNGRTVASESLHLQGIAADIHIDEITEKALHDYAVSLGRGGVGIYAPYNFVHVDLGPVRTWGEAKAKERVLVGIEANPNQSWKIVTDKNEYKKGEPMEFSVTNVTYDTAKLTKNIWYEHFRKGAWAEHEMIEKKKKTHVLKPGNSVSYKVNTDNLPYGKYRLVLFTSEDFNVPPAYSNEFYIKKE